MPRTRPGDRGEPLGSVNQNGYVNVTEAVVFSVTILLAGYEPVAPGIALVDTTSDKESCDRETYDDEIEHEITNLSKNVRVKHIRSHNERIVKC